MSNYGFKRIELTIITVTIRRVSMQLLDLNTVLKMWTSADLEMISNAMQR